MLGWLKRRKKDPLTELERSDEERAERTRVKGEQVRQAAVHRSAKQECQELYRVYREMYFARLRYLYQDDTRIKATVPFSEWGDHFRLARYRRTKEWDAMTYAQRVEWAQKVSK